MAELQTDIAAMRRAFFRALRLTAAIALPASAGTALVADDMVAVLLGPKWLPAVTVLRLLCLYAAVRAVDVLLPPVLVARRRSSSDSCALMAARAHYLQPASAADEMPLVPSLLGLHVGTRADS